MKATKISKYYSFIILIVITIISVISSKFNIFAKIDYRIFDFMLGQTKGAQQCEDIVLIDIDDDSLAKVGSWPWPRDIIGNVLIRMKEFGSRQAVFDIEYISPSVKAVDENLEKKVNDNFAMGQQAITSYLTTFGTNIASGVVTPDYAQSESEIIAQEISNNILYEMMRDITSDFNKDNDDYFARALQFFGRANVTINMRDIGFSREPEEIEYNQQRFLFDNVIDPHGYIKRCNEFSVHEEGSTVKLGFVPVIQKIASRANGAGFTNVVVDRDGTRRRVELLNEHDGKYVGQLSFGPLMKNLDAQEMERTRNSLIVRGLKWPGQEERRDIKIPLDKYGRLVINWLHEEYGDSFIHVPAYLFYNLDLVENLIVEQLDSVKPAVLEGLYEEDAQYLYEGARYFFDEYQKIAKMKTRMLLKCRGFDIENNPIKGGLNQEDYDRYFALRNEFFGQMKDFCSSLADVTGALDVREIADLKDSLEHYLSDFQVLKSTFTNAFVFIGNSASSSTDLGVTPFTKRYPNLGTHANVLNTILQEDFIAEKSPLVAIGIGFALALMVLVFFRKVTPGKRNLLGIAYIILPLAILYVSMVVFKIYIPIMDAGIMITAIYVAETALNFRMINAEKKFITSAFSQCLSPDVVKDIVKNSDNFRLGGDTHNMSAIFTDIQKFSGFSEVLNASELVALLNYYLTPMSDKIMDEGGTVDKYEGDAIVAFVGAPVHFENHAARACTAAIKMKKYEKEMNQLILDYAAKDEAPELPPDLFSAFKKMAANRRGIFTRIGINSGEMVAGFMGSENKKNYTMMGNNVNLASRLEGVNKQYRTGGILVSEATCKDLGDEFIVRSLDRVQVVNVKTPMRLYEVLDFKKDAPELLVKYMEKWEEGMKHFEKGMATMDKNSFSQALLTFKKLASVAEKLDVFDRDADRKPGSKVADKVAEYYIELIEKFFLQGTWPKPEDDFGVAFNSENPADMDPSWVGTKYEIKGTFTLLQK